MALDLEQVVSQISGMVDRLRSGEQEKRLKLERAIETLRLHAGKVDELSAKQERSKSKTTWLVAGLTNEGLAAGLGLPPIPTDYTSLATDGSHIDVDRHQSATCYLINIGKVSLSYGSGPDATLGSAPFLYYDDEQMVVASLEPGQDGQRVEGAILGAKRMIEECRALAAMVGAATRDRPAVALLDGSLVLWDLEGKKYLDFVVDALVKNGLLKCLDELQQACTAGRIAFGSYISSPRSTEVVNLLRVALCPFDSPDCDRYCKGKGKELRECEGVAGLRDSSIFAELLAPGERSAVFTSHSRVVDRHYGNHRIRFFYLNVQDEIARIEVPLWVAQRKDLVDIAHSLVFDQCRKGDGYPVALAEAHEKAVLTVSDREQFWRLVELTMVSQGASASVSAKSRSKRRPFV